MNTWNPELFNLPIKDLAQYVKVVLKNEGHKLPKVPSPPVEEWELTWRQQQGVSKI